MCATAIALAIAFIPTAYAAPGDIHNLGTLGGTVSFASDITNDGRVAGSAYTTGDAARHAFRYSGTPGAGGAMVNLGTLGGSESIGFSMNDAGQMVGDSQPTSEPGLHAFLYTGTPGEGGVMTDLGTLGGLRSHGRDINEAGQVAGLAFLSDVVVHAFLYSGPPGAGTMIDLGTLGGTNSQGLGINDSGQVTGLAGTQAGPPHAFLYSGTPGAGGAMADLGTLGGPGSEGRAINNAAQVVGDSGTVPGSALSIHNHAFLYTGTPGAGGKMIDLGTLGGPSSRASEINDAGFVVGVADRSADVTGRDWPALWLNDAAHTMIDLDVWLDATNPALGAYWTLNTALDLNDNGLITGTGTYNDGAGGLTDGQRAYILDASSLVSLRGDFDDDDDFTAADIDLLCAGIRAGVYATMYDVNADNQLDAADR